jgi:hypothetical protein
MLYVGLGSGTITFSQTNGTRRGPLRGSIWSPLIWLIGLISELSKSKRYKNSLQTIMDQFVTQTTLQTWYKKQEKGETIEDTKVSLWILNFKASY